MKLEKLLFVPDTHVPYHDVKAWSLLLKVGKVLRPDRIVILGDFADFYAVSDHDKDPNRARGLESEIKSCRERLDELDALGASKKYYVSGNHEDRLERYLMRRAPELFNMVKIPEILGLRERGWSYVPYKSDVRIGKVYITHDTGVAGANAHQRALTDYQTNVIIGHTHRLGYAVVGNAKGEPHVGAMLGWLGDFDKVDYMHSIKARRDWAHGFGLGYMRPDGVVHIHPVPIVRNSVVVEGKLISL